MDRVTFATPEEKEQAEKILDGFGWYAFSCGHRNDDCVNAMIALHVLGIDEEGWFECWSEKFEWDETLKKLVSEHRDRIRPYLESWGPAGAEGDALNYII